MINDFTTQHQDSKVVILMATYNGAKFIKSQLESISAQSYKNWQLYIRDDGSADDTRNIIASYINADDRMHILKDDLGNVGSAKNFSILIESNKNKDAYIMLSDQDDYWLQDKISITLNSMQESERRFSFATPVLAYTNFTYADTELKKIIDKKKFTATKFNRLTFTNILAQNPAYGCTMMLNNSLINLITAIPEEAENHDYWIALVAAAFGKIVYIPVSTILYRQHGENVSGLHNNNTFKKRFKRVINNKNINDVHNKLFMAQAFKSIYKKTLSNNSLKSIDDFILLVKKKSFALLIKNWNNGLKRQTFTQTFLFYLSIAFYNIKKTEFDNRH